ncbi:hypothetical protein [Spirillospora sp. NPDC047279]|uniref:hypothetical protein n=1 Tax=Spirillospora sp. NPDC047279 TaxID=3155478 RepID=UPI0033E0130E
MTKNRVIVMTLTAAFGLLLSLVAGLPAAAQTSSDRNSVAAAGQPHAVPVAGGGRDVHHVDFLWSLEGGRSAAAAYARDYVHALNGRGQCDDHDDLCTIQIFNNDRYRVFHFHGCGVFHLYDFTGLFDTHNHRSSTAIWLSQNYSEIGWYTGGMRAPVDWGPVHHIRTCA